MQGGTKMKLGTKLIIAATVLLAIIGFGYPLFGGPGNARACGSGCGWGTTSGGSDYAPQQRGGSGFLAQKQDLTREQARDIVSNYVKKLNPDLAVGKITDNGNFYEAEIVSQGKDVVQRLGVDKRSGRLIMLN